MLKTIQHLEATHGVEWVVNKHYWMNEWLILSGEGEEVKDWGDVQRL